MIASAPGGVLVVTGTGTGVGKTVATAAIAALAAGRGERVAVVKPAQTGVRAGEPGDVAEVVRLAGLSASDGYELARFADPLAPATAARLAGREPVSVEACAELVRRLAGGYDLVLVEGAGGLLVRYSDGASSVAGSGRGAPTTLAELAGLVGAPVLVVADPALGTLNQTALTLEALDRRGLPVAGVLLGHWPATPDLACRTNLADLETLAGRPLAGALPAGLGTLPPTTFAAAARTGLGPGLGGGFDAADFRRTHGTIAAPEQADSREHP